MHSFEPDFPLRFLQTLTRSERIYVIDRQIELLCERVNRSKAGRRQRDCLIRRLEQLNIELAILQGKK